MAQVIESEFYVHSHVDHIGRLLSALGWNPQKPQRRAVERDDPKRVSFIARLHSINGEEPELPTQSVIDPIIADLEAA